jgi:hypothetical protein
MATSVMIDVADSGKISVFISAAKVLFACEKGHWWIVEATDYGDASPPPPPPPPGPGSGTGTGPKRAPSGKAPRSAPAQGTRAAKGTSARQIAALERSFGAAPLQVMGLASRSTVSSAGRSSPRRQRARTQATAKEAGGRAKRTSPG